MAKKVTGYIKLQLPAGEATPAPPVGPALGQHGVNIMEFVKQFNAKSVGAVEKGTIVPVVITVYGDRSFSFILKTPPAAVLIKKKLGLDKGSATPTSRRWASSPSSSSKRSPRPRCPISTRAAWNLPCAPSRAPLAPWASKSSTSSPILGIPSGVRRMLTEDRAVRNSRQPRPISREIFRRGVVMAKPGKKYRAAASKIEDRPYDLNEALNVIKDLAFAKFDETVEVHMRLGVDPRHADQMVRGTIVLPHGTGKTMRVAVIAGGEKIKEAEAAGAEIVGGDDLVERIAGGFLEFDALVATPDMMKGVGRLGKVLGPRGLMPNPKTGTVTFDVAKAIKEIKAGKVEYRVDKTGIIHAGVGKLSFGIEKLAENARALIDAVHKAKPSAAKGKYVKAIHMASTMGPSVTVSTSIVEK